MIRIATYNVHKCKGLDGRTSAERICDVIAELDADIIALQEILRVPPRHSSKDDGQTPDDQVCYIARCLKYHFRFGENREHLSRPYGNATLSRLPIERAENYDITWRRYERRGCLRTDISIGSNTHLHFFNVHLGTSFFERPHQARRLLSSDVLQHVSLRHPRVVVGDFNEWTRGIATRMMGAAFASVDAKILGRRKTYPGILPFLHLDHFYYDKLRLKLVSARLHRSRTALVASDHLPIVAEFEHL